MKKSKPKVDPKIDPVVADIPEIPIINPIDPQVAEAINQEQEILTKKWGEQADIKIDRIMGNLKRAEMTPAQKSAFKERLNFVSTGRAPPKVARDFEEPGEIESAPLITPQYQINWDENEDDDDLQYLEHFEMNENLLAETLITVIEDQQEIHNRVADLIEDHPNIPALAQGALLSATPQAKLEKMKRSIKDKIIQKEYIESRNAELQAREAAQLKKVEEANAKLKEKLAKAGKNLKSTFVSPPMTTDLLQGFESLKDRPFRLDTPVLERFDDDIGWKRPDRMQKELAAIDQHYAISQREQDELNRLQEIEDRPIDVDNVDFGEFGEDLMQKVHKSIELFNESSEFLGEIEFEFPDDEYVKEIAQFLKEKNLESTKTLERVTANYISEIYSLTNYNLSRKSVLSRYDAPEAREEIFKSPPRIERAERDQVQKPNEMEVQRTARRREQELQKMQASSK